MQETKDCYFTEPIPRVLERIIFCVMDLIHKSAGEYVSLLTYLLKFFD